MTFTYKFYNNEKSHFLVNNLLLESQQRELDLFLYPNSKYYMDLSLIIPYLMKLNHISIARIFGFWNISGIENNKNQFEKFLERVKFNICKKFIQENFCLSQAFNHWSFCIAKIIVKYQHKFFFLNFQN